MRGGGNWTSGDVVAADAVNLVDVPSIRGCKGCCVSLTSGVVSRREWLDLMMLYVVRNALKLVNVDFVSTRVE